MRSKHIDRPFFLITALLVISGIFIFASASLGLLTRSGASFSSVAFNQIVLGLSLGIIGGAALTYVDYKKFKRLSFFLFAGALLLLLAVFLPVIGFDAGGARRWLLVGPLTLQPSEIMKLAYVLYLAAWLSGVRQKISTFTYGIVPFILITAVAVTPILLEPDTDTSLVIMITGLCMLFASGARLRHIALLGLLGLIVLSTLVFTQPYIKERILTFLDPGRDPYGGSYQIQQSLIAIGSGEVFGRGFGQSVQKFQHLPEPIGDSIFAVASEEFGFIGASALIILFLLFIIRGLRIATHTKDSFGGLAVVGIVILIGSQSFINIAALLGLIPLAGTPLIFISHGGTALLLALLEVGIVLNISRTQTG